MYRYTDDISFALKHLACRAGYYGKSCSKICSLNCKTCRNTDGLCSCFAGWSGFYCNAGNFNTEILFDVLLNKFSKRNAIYILYG